MSELGVNMDTSYGLYLSAQLGDISFIAYSFIVSQV